MSLWLFQLRLSRQCERTAFTLLSRRQTLSSFTIKDPRFALRIAGLFVLVWYNPAMETIILSVIVLVFSVILHEIAHGVMANNLGDPTARYAGRLTLNPIPHIDIYGSIIVPFFLILTHSPVLLGWAKPVPYNPANIRNPYGDALVAAAGPLTNLFLAVIFGLLVRSGFGAGDEAVMQLLIMIVHTNVLLCIFNLLPMPTLDGAKVLSAFIPKSMTWKYEKFRARLERDPMISIAAILFFVLFLGNIFHSIVWNTALFLMGA